MNAMSDNPEDGGDGVEPPIILIGFERKSYYLFKGDEYLNQILLTDGEFPKPILCVHFESVFDAAQVFGTGFKISDYWGVHPDIVARLRDTDCLVETDA